MSENFFVGYDSITDFNAYTWYDSLDLVNSAINLLGEYADPVFGVHTANIMTQFVLYKSNTVFPDSLSADSLVLSLYSSERYNWIESPVEERIWINIYQISNNLDTEIFDSIKYYDFNAEEYYDEDNDFLTSAQLELDELNRFQIHLPQWLAETLLNANDSNYVDDETFQDYFKGLYLKFHTRSEFGEIYTINLQNANSALSLHYSEVMEVTVFDTTLNDSVVVDSTFRYRYDFGIDESCAKINVFEHDYNQSSILDINDSIQEDTVFYVQGMSGLKGRIEAPFLNSWIDSTGIVINKAELTFYVQEDASYTERYAVPNKLILTGINQDGSPQIIPEYVLADQYGITYEGATYNSTIKGYTYNIASYLQDLIDENNKILGFYLQPSGSNSNPGRVVLRAGSNSKPITFKVTYSKIN